MSVADAAFLGVEADRRELAGETVGDVRFRVPACEGRVI